MGEIKKSKESSKTAGVYPLHFLYEGDDSSPNLNAKSLKKAGKGRRPLSRMAMNRRQRSKLSEEKESQPRKLLRPG